MPEDEYDFEGLNPGKLFAIDEQAESFDYEAQIQSLHLVLIIKNPSKYGPE